MSLLKNAIICAQIPFRRDYRFKALAQLMGYYKSMPDEEYLRRKFRATIGRELNLDNPDTFNAKLNWLKLYNRRPEYTLMVDKYEAKKYAAEIIGSEYIIQTLGIYESFDEIDFDTLPEKFVLKCTHDCGSVIVVRNKKKFNRDAARKRFTKAMRKNHFWVSREWPYKNVKPRIIAEKFMQDGDNANLPVYKIFNFDGTPKLIQAIQNDKKLNESIDYFDTEWHKLNLRQQFRNSRNTLPKPEYLDKMLELAAKLSSGIPHVRTDLYHINGQIYFSEFTFFSDGAFERFHPYEWDEKLGSWLKLPEKYDLTKPKEAIQLTQDSGLRTNYALIFILHSKRRRKYTVKRLITLPVRYYERGIFAETWRQRHELRKDSRQIMEGTYRSNIAI